MTPETPVYVPGYGEMTAGQVAEMLGAERIPAVDDEWEGTLQMWEYIALHPDARPWETSGHTSPERGASPVSASTNVAPADHSTSSGTGTGVDSSAA